MKRYYELTKSASGLEQLKLSWIISPTARYTSYIIRRAAQLNPKLHTDHISLDETKVTFQDKYLG
jgi:hypothetical protein